jgi:hypothetical protein
MEPPAADACAGELVPTRQDPGTRAEPRARAATLWKLSVSGNLGVRLGNQIRSRKGRPRRLLRRPLGGYGRATSARRINRILDALQEPTTYLEVGVWRGTTLENVRATRRYGVDPAPRFDLARLPKNVDVESTTSDAYFEHLDHDMVFDVIFLDGEHTFRQTYADLLHALDHLDGGVVLVDDTIPTDEVSALPDERVSRARRKELGLPGTPWHGDVWKLVVCLAQFHGELGLRTIVGSGNPQTLVWRTDRGATSRRVDHLIEGEVERLTYRETFESGIPDVFQPCSEDEAISAVLEFVQPR